MRPPLTLEADLTLRSLLLDYFVETVTGQELSDWLRDIDQDPRGTIQEKKARVLATTKYLNMPVESFPEQTINYLKVFSSDHLCELCEVLGLESSGTKDTRWCRILREVGFREGWLLRSIGNPASAAIVHRFVDWHFSVIQRNGGYEKDYYPVFFSDMEEIFGRDLVYEQVPLSFGTTLKIDFHIGHPRGIGVGIELKMPTNNSDLQRAIGQLEQYQAQYRDKLIMVLLSDFLSKAQTTLFCEIVNEKGILLVVKDS